MVGEGEKEEEQNKESQKRRESENQDFDEIKRDREAETTFKCEIFSTFQDLKFKLSHLFLRLPEVQGTYFCSRIQNWALGQWAGSRTVKKMNILAPNNTKRNVTSVNECSFSCRMIHNLLYDTGVKSKLLKRWPQSMIVLSLAEWFKIFCMIVEPSKSHKKGDWVMTESQ